MTTITTDEGKFNLPEHSNLLETLEKLGYAVEYQCRSGYCGSCRIKLLSGCVSYAQLPMAFLQPDEILPCCCQVQTDLHIKCCFRQPED